MSIRRVKVLKSRVEEMLIFGTRTLNNLDDETIDVEIQTRIVVHAWLRANFYRGHSSKQLNRVAPLRRTTVTFEERDRESESEIRGRLANEKGTLVFAPRARQNESFDIQIKNGKKTQSTTTTFQKEFVKDEFVKENKEKREKERKN